jgi:hypothetical protein
MASVVGHSTKSKPSIAGRLIAALNEKLFGTYRPEKHYMRGPGPKCREKLERSQDRL